MTVEAVLRMSRYTQLSRPADENATELFLSEYPNGEIRKYNATRKHKRHGTTRLEDQKNEMRREKDWL